jgi:hypothetical protein
MFSTPSIFGAVLIVAIKFVGYRYAGIWLNRAFGRHCAGDRAMQS